jgi:hypothetical protein
MVEFNYYQRSRYEHNDTCNFRISIVMYKHTNITKQFFTCYAAKCIPAFFPVNVNCRNNPFAHCETQYFLDNSIVIDKNRWSKYILKKAAEYFSNTPKNRIDGAQI